MEEEIEVERFPKYPKIRIIGDEENKDMLSDPKDKIVIEEKIDGANFRFMVHEDGYLIFGSRSNELDIGRQNEKAWRRCIEHIKPKFVDIEIAFFKGFLFYGECCTRHSIAYDFENMPPYLGYDIFDLKNGIFISYPRVKKMFEELGLDFVPVIKECKAKDIKEINEDMVPNSKYYPGPAEGIMMKNYKKQLMGKFVTEKFKEVNKESFGMSKKWAKDDTERLCAVYCRNPRIDKMIFKLIDEGMKLDMVLMSKLPVRVYEDIIEEHWKDILTDANTKIDVRALRKIVAGRCLAVLKQVITNNALV